MRIRKDYNDDDETINIYSPDITQSTSSAVVDNTDSPTETFVQCSPTNGWNKNVNAMKENPHAYDCGNEISKASLRNCMKLDCLDNITRYDTRSCHRYVSDIAAHIYHTPMYMGKKRVPNNAIVSFQNIGTNDWAKCYGYCMNNEVSSGFQFDTVTSNCSCIKNHEELKSNDLMSRSRKELKLPDYDDSHKDEWIFTDGEGEEATNDMVIGVRDGPFKIFGGENWSCGGHYKGKTERCDIFLKRNDNRSFFGPTEAFNDDTRLCESNNALPLENISISYPQDL